MFIASHKDVYLENKKLMLNLMKVYDVKYKILAVMSKYSNTYLLEVIALNLSGVSLQIFIHMENIYDFSF